VLTTADYEHFGALFDDPVYNTDTSVFGAVSDIDNNGRVIIVLTPAVNRLTPKGTGSFIGGYFYACDCSCSSAWRSSLRSQHRRSQDGRRRTMAATCG
jgi:hypothetical protein